MMTDYDYVQEHFDELARFCPQLKIERVLQGIVRTIDVFGEPKGFISLEVAGDTLRIIALFIEKGAPRALLHRVAKETIGWAEANGLTKIEFDTTRPGWAKRMASYGFEPLPYYRMTRSSHG